MILSSLFALLLGCGPSVDAVPEIPTDPVVQEMRTRPLYYTRHARCRMGCRHISESEVEAILGGAGKLDPKRTRTDGECPSHALEGRTEDGQQVRIVYAACAENTRVVTAIDLDREWKCDCF